MDTGVRDPARNPRFVVIPTNGRDCLRQSVEAIEDEVDCVILVTTEDKAAAVDDLGDVVLTHDGRINISQWWNIGLDFAATLIDATTDRKKWDVAIINDDVIVPPGWFSAVSGKMREMKAAAGCSGGRSPMPWFLTHVGATPGVPNPLEGFAFIVAGELGLRANENIPWYFSDNYMDWESRRLGGTVVIPGFHVQHLYPNGQMDWQLHEANTRGAQAFREHFGAMPW